MAKNKSKQTIKKAAGNRPRRKTVIPRMAASREQMYAALLRDPDSAVVPTEGVYDGELGEFKRFIATITSNTTAGHNCGFLAFCPRTGNGFSASGNNPTTALNFAVTNLGYPGQVYLNANAAKVRGLAAKLEFSPSGSSITNITGEVAVGIVTVNNFISGTTTVDHLFDVSKAYRPIERKLTTARWFPGGLDHTYENYNVGINEDSNLVFVAWRNAVSGVGIPIRITYVAEYTVKNTIGVPPTGAVSRPVGHAEVVRQLQQHDPHWHHSVLDELKAAGSGIAKDVGVAARYMARMGLTKLGQTMAKAAPGALALI